jgi:hypothetical protein
MESKAGLMHCVNKKDATKRSPEQRSPIFLDTLGLISNCLNIIKAVGAGRDLGKSILQNVEMTKGSGLGLASTRHGPR